MNISAKAFKGYYSILQFVPNLERSEGANIGVVLYCPERMFLDAKVSSNNDRVRHFFGRKEYDFQRIDSMKQSFVERVRNSASSITSNDDFRRFVDSRANCLRLTVPRTLKVFEPATELDKLFHMLVGERPKAKEQRIKVDQIVRNLESELKKRDVWDLVKRDVQIDLPVFRKTESYPFAFTNGQRNLIKPTVFGIDKEKVGQKASKLAIEGKVLLDRNYKLNVLAGFTDFHELDLVRGILEQFQVTLYEVDEMQRFAELIAQTAHD